MVLFGGYDGSNTHDVWTLDLTSYIWTEVTTSATKPSARYGHSSVLYNEHMVMFGGYNGSSRYNDVWTLNLTSYDWTEVTTLIDPSQRANGDVWRT